MAFAMAFVLVFAAAACGNSKKEATPTTTTAPKAGGPETSGPTKNVPVDAPGVSDTEIRLGGVASVDNPLGGRYGDSFKGVQAYIDMVNASGGIYGRKLVLAAQRDDKAFNNSTEVKALLTEDNVFAVIPIATLLFTGADELVAKGVPTFGWTINPEWEGSTENPKSNLFGQTGSFLCFDCAAPGLPWLMGQAKAHKIGVLAYSVPQSADCASGVEAALDKFGKQVNATVGFSDKTLQFAQKDLSVQVSKMKQAGVDFVATCMDTNGVVTLAKEMKKQRLNAVQSLPNAYDHEFLDEFGDLFEGSYVRTDFATFELPEKDQPPGLKLFLSKMKDAGVEPTENALAGWLNADLFIQGMKKAGPDFSRQKLIDAINTITDFTADGIVYPVDWTKAHTQTNDDDHNCQFFSVIEDGKFVPKFSRPGKPFVCPVIKPDSLGTRYTADN
jgi:ABC-type branched-subunit amino acid transport system substrate-binding protein